jgi:hypothetical protein
MTLTRLAGTTVLPPEFGQLVNGSDYIVHGRVKSVEAEKREGARGSRIYTRVHLEVIELVAGVPPREIVLQLLGGKVGKEEMRVVGMPRFEVGDEDILFVSGNGRAICPLFGMMHGRFPILVEGGERVVARSDRMPLRSTAEIATLLPEPHRAEARRSVNAVAGLRPAEFIQQVRAAVRPDAKLHRAP